LVTPLRVAWVSVSTAVTAALGSTAPLRSVTVPASALEVPLCALAGAPESRAQRLQRLRTHAVQREVALGSAEMPEIVGLLLNLGIPNFAFFPNLNWVERISKIGGWRRFRAARAWECRQCGMTRAR
jgi:hypothetical protein